MRTTSFLLAGLSSLALAFSAIALFRHHDTPLGLRPAGEGNAELGQEIAQLREEMSDLKRHIDASSVNSVPQNVEDLDRRLTALESLAAGTNSGDGARPSLALGKLEDLDDEQFEKFINDDRMEKLTSKALSRIQRRKASAGFRRWINPGRDGIEGVLRRTFEKLTIDPQRQEQVRRIVWAANETQNALMDELSADPPPDEQEGFRIMGEIKQVFGTRNEELGEVLNEEELRTFQRVEAIEVKTGPDPEEEEVDG